MKEPKTIETHLTHISNILIRGAAISAVILLAWFFWLVNGSDFGAGYFAYWFDLSQNDFIRLNLVGMMILKIIGLVFFLIPYAALKLYKRNLNQHV